MRNRRAKEVDHSTRAQSVRRNRVIPKRSTQVASGRTALPSLSSDAPPDNMDSTLFFPVGSSVKHKIHGDGMVIDPPNNDNEFAEKMLVKVRFTDENIEWDLPLDGLTHTYG